jgi:hypothetical protein
MYAPDDDGTREVVNYNNPDTSEVMR